MLLSCLHRDAVASLWTSGRERPSSRSLLSLRGVGCCGVCPHVFVVLFVFVKKEKCPSEVTTGNSTSCICSCGRITPEKNLLCFSDKLWMLLILKLLCVCVMDKEYKKTFNVIIL